MTNVSVREKLPTSVKLSLFISSYFPLFLIIIMRQIEQNCSYLAWGGIDSSAIKLFISKFGISVALGVASLYGLTGLYFFLKNSNEITNDNGHILVVDKTQNKNTESIGYVATYLLPFVFQTYSSFFDIVLMIVPLSVMYIIYTHSTLIVVNPVLNIWYSLYEVEYHDIKLPYIRKNGIFIVNCHYLEKNDNLLAKKLNSNLFYGIIQEDGK